MSRSRVRDGRKAHNKRIRKRREIMEHIMHLKKKIYEEGKARWIEEQREQKLPQLKIDESGNNS